MFFFCLVPVVKVMTSSQPQVKVTLSEDGVLTLPPAFVSLNVETICPQHGTSKALRREFLRPEGDAYFDASCGDCVKYVGLRTLVKATPTCLVPDPVLDPPPPPPPRVIVPEKPNVSSESWGAKGFGAVAGVVASGILGSGVALGLLALAGGPSEYAPEVAKFGGGSAMLGSVLSLPHGLLFSPKATEPTPSTTIPTVPPKPTPTPTPPPRIDDWYFTASITQRRAARPVDLPPSTPSEWFFGTALSTIQKSSGANDEEKALLESDTFTQRRLGKYYFCEGTPARASAQHKEYHIMVEVLPPENDVKAKPAWLVLGKDESNMSLWRAASSEAAAEVLKKHAPTLTIDASGAVAHPDAKVHDLLQWWRSAPPHYNPVSADSVHFAADVASRIERNAWAEHQPLGHPARLPYVVAGAGLGVCVTAACAVVWRRSALRAAKPHR